MALKNGQHLNKEWCNRQYRHKAWTEAKDLLQAHTVSGTHLEVWQSLQNRCYLSSKSLHSKEIATQTYIKTSNSIKRMDQTLIYLGQLWRKKHSRSDCYPLKALHIRLALGKNLELGFWGGSHHCQNSLCLHCLYKQYSSCWTPASLLGVWIFVRQRLPMCHPLVKIWVLSFFKSYWCCWSRNHTFLAKIKKQNTFYLFLAQ